MSRSCPSSEDGSGPSTSGSGKADEKSYLKPQEHPDGTSSIVVEVSGLKLLGKVQLRC